MDSTGQISIFDAIAAREAAERGITLAAGKHAALLAIAREAARDIALERPSRTVTADDVQAWLADSIGYDEGSLENAMGSVFRGKHWYWDGFSVVKSQRPKSHGRLLRVWKLK